MTFHVGQKVVCIDDAFTHPGWEYYLTRGVVLPRKGPIYTIRRFFSAIQFVDAIMPGIYLEEIRNPEFFTALSDLMELPFWIGRFRPLIERKKTTDISIFRKMLNNEPVNA